jgi:REP element-mobilizing transposase RayT
MPNHLHALVCLVTDRRGPQSAPNKARNEFRSPSRTIGSLVRGFKGAAARRIRELWRDPQANVWQRNYYEYVVRNAREYDAICRYMQENPQRWEFDENNPARFS